ncbi:netrin receptor UNC5C-like [Gigantopelta aegis]|uniref:netrin receptor UNC5C-like n=1 Tax=Gigantopelta aegis TaxID=1735272 RepID=UPI001B889A0A|nr:netrin receptor UNC5C-like [Gigantopelta aegis]
MNSLLWILYILGLLIISVPRSSSIDGQWTAWVTIQQGVCDDECNGTTTYKRYCNDPAPSDDGKKCTGPNMLYYSLDCTWNKCIVAKYLGLDLGIFILILVLVLILLIGCVICVFVRNRREKDPETQQIIVLKSKDNGGEEGFHRATPSPTL